MKLELVEKQTKKVLFIGYYNSFGALNVAIKELKQKNYDTDNYHFKIS